MKVFISHTFFDEDLKLAQSLEQLLFKVGIEGYLAETRRTYDKLIRDKIILEIKNSDHMIAILTEKTFDSASVNQELGYAMREGILPVIMLEKNAKQGVLTFGIDPEEFTKATFLESCKKVLTHIQDKGPRKKIPESLSDISMQLEKIESKLDNQKPLSTVGHSDKNPEGQWYSDIMNYYIHNPYASNKETIRTNAKKNYSKIQMLRQEISEISNTYNSSGIYERANLTQILQTKKNDLKFELKSLSELWSKAS